jgi:hypothetical protein
MDFTRKEGVLLQFRLTTSQQQEPGIPMIMAFVLVKDLSNWVTYFSYE